MSHRPTTIPETVARWREPVERIHDRYARASRGGEPTTLYPETCLAQIWSESAGRLGLEDYAGSNHWGILQIGDLAAETAGGLVDDLPDDPDPRYYSERGRDSIRAWYAIQLQYRETTRLDPLLMWSMWAAGPSAVESYTARLEQSGATHPDREAIEATIGEIFSAPIDYLLETSARARALYSQRRANS